MKQYAGKTITIKSVREFAELEKQSGGNFKKETRMLMAIPYSWRVDDCPKPANGRFTINRILEMPNGDLYARITDYTMDENIYNDVRFSVPVN